MASQSSAHGTDHRGEHVEFRSGRLTSTLAGLCPAVLELWVPRRSKADPVAQAFGQAVRQARESRRETLEDVARRIPRMDAKYLGELERGWHAPTIPTAKRIATALETTLAALVHDI